MIQLSYLFFRRLTQSRWIFANFFFMCPFFIFQPAFFYSYTKIIIFTYFYTFFSFLRWSFFTTTFFCPKELFDLGNLFWFRTQIDSLFGIKFDFFMHQFWRFTFESEFLLHHWEQFFASWRTLCFFIITVWNYDIFRFWRIHLFLFPIFKNLGTFLVFSKLWILKALSLFFSQFGLFSYLLLISNFLLFQVIQLYFNFLPFFLLLIFKVMSFKKTIREWKGWKSEWFRSYKAFWGFGTFKIIINFINFFKKQILKFNQSLDILIKLKKLKFVNVQFFL